MRHVRWLLDELPGLVDAGVIDAATAARLRDHYGRLPRADARATALTVFAVLGATLIAAGVLLLLAHNWDQLGRPVRAALSLGLLAATQALGAYAALRHRGSAAWSEATASAWTLAIGASLALVSQTYHLTGETHDFLGTWLALALPVPYLLDARFAGLLYLLGAATWVGVVPTEGLADRAVLWQLGLLPLVVSVARRPGVRRDVLLGLGVVAALATDAGLAVGRVEALAPWWAAVLVGGLAALGATPGLAPGIGAPARLSAAVGAFVLVVTMSWDGTWSHGAVHADGLPAIAWLAVGLAVTLLGGVAAARAVARGDLTGALLPALPAVVGVTWLLDRAAHGELGALAANLLGGAAGVALLLDGLRHGAAARANTGLALVATLALARFFDADVSMVVRGIAFIAVGVGFLAANVRLVRAREAA